jgi:serine protease Do
MARALKLNQPNGIIIGSVQRGGPADKAGLESEDVIVAIDNEPIREWAQLRTKIASTPPGETIQLKVVRDGREREVRVTLEALDSDQVASATPDGGGSSDDTDGAGDRDAELDAEARSLVEDLGLSLTDLSDLTEELRARARVGEDVEGVLVTSVTETSRAYRQGLRPGDVITQIQGEAVDSPKTAGRVLLSLNQRGEEAILLRIQRQGQRLFIAIDF